MTGNSDSNNLAYLMSISGKKLIRFKYENFKKISLKDNSRLSEILNLNHKI